jgi:hypothetical protein
MFFCSLLNILDVADRISSLGGQDPRSISLAVGASCSYVSLVESRKPVRCSFDQCDHVPRTVQGHIRTISGGSNEVEETVPEGMFWLS